MKQVIHTDSAPAAIGPYTQAIQIGDLLFVSGQVPIDPSTGAIVEGDVKAQAQQSLNNLKAILNAAGLSFIGLGVQPPIPEWGAMLSAARQYIRDYWWMLTFPGLAIMLTVFALNVLGDGLRDSPDPRPKS